MKASFVSIFERWDHQSEDKTWALLLMLHFSPTVRVGPELQAPHRAVDSLTKILAELFFF